MIISTCGYGTTGASAVADFLKGYSQIQNYTKSELQFLHQPDGICDLKYQLTSKCDRISSNAAIQRFIRMKQNSESMLLRKQCSDFDRLIDEYIEKIIVCKWKGRSNGDPPDVTNLSRFDRIRFLQRAIDYFLRKRNKKWHFPAYQTRYYAALSEEEFISMTRDFLSKLFDSMGIDLKNDVLFDMLFSACNPSAGMEFFDDARAIIVDRDPRDLFLAAQRNVWANAYMPWDSVESFCAYYRTIRKTAKTAENILRVQYEDLIYHYYETTETIMKFIGRRDRPDKEFAFFNPDISVKYTNRKVDQVEYIDQMTYIENNLSEYLYKFESYISIEKQEKHYNDKA